jgi:hypothetical protein
MKFDKLAALLIVALLSGCATEQFRPPATTSRYQEMLAAWKNRDINDLIYAWGPPNSTFTMPNTNRMFTWDNIKIGPAVTNTSGSSVYVGRGLAIGSGQSETFTKTWDCYTTAISDSTGTIISWKLRGNNCVLGYSDEEIKNNLDSVHAIMKSLKKGTHVRLTIYGGLVDQDGNSLSGNFEGYFADFDNTNDTVSIRKQPKINYWTSDTSEWFQIKHIQQLVLLEDADKATK